MIILPSVAKLEKRVVSEINFNVNGEAYTAEEGMLWSEWMQSEYCPRGWYLDNSGAVRDAYYREIVDYSNSELAMGSDYILAEGEYGY